MNRRPCYIKGHVKRTRPPNTFLDQGSQDRRMLDLDRCPRISRPLRFDSEQWTQLARPSCLLGASQRSHSFRHAGLSQMRCSLLCSSRSSVSRNTGRQHTRQDGERSRSAWRCTRKSYQTRTDASGIETREHEAHRSGCTRDARGVRERQRFATTACRQVRSFAGICQLDLARQDVGTCGGSDHQTRQEHAHRGRRTPCSGSLETERFTKRSCSSAWCRCQHDQLHRVWCDVGTRQVRSS